MPTLSTLPLGLLALYLYKRSHGQLLPVVLFMSVFEAASFINVGGTGVQISYLLLIVAIAKAVWRYPKQASLFGTRPKKTTVIVSLFILYAVVSAFTNPVFFKGVLIFNPKLSYEQVPLEWNAAFLNQLFYLLVLFGLYLTAAYRTKPEELVRALNWFVGGCVFAAFLAIYQFAGMKTGLPFPSAFLYTNPTFQIFDAYDMGGVARVNTTFPEASAAAFTLTIALAIVIWQILAGAAEMKNLIFALILLVGLIFTASTTGYLCLLYILGGASLLYVFRWKGNSQFRKTKLIIGSVISAGLLFAAATATVREEAWKTVNTVVLDKTQTFSYKERTQWNENALKTAENTLWFGAGWGVCRASSFIPTILANVGIPGTLLFYGFCLKILWPAIQRRRLRLRVHGAVLFAVGAALLNMAINSPDLSHCILWLLFGLGAKLGESGSAGRSIVSHSDRAHHPLRLQAI